MSLKTRFKLTPSTNDKINEFHLRIQILYDAPQTFDEGRTTQRLEEICGILERTAVKNPGVVHHTIACFVDIYDRRTLPTIVDVRDVLRHSWSLWGNVEKNMPRITKDMGTIISGPGVEATIKKFPKLLDLIDECGVSVIANAAYPKFDGSLPDGESRERWARLQEAIQIMTLDVKLPADHKLKGAADAFNSFQKTILADIEKFKNGEKHGQDGD
ncbi:MAG: hypothetical protein GY952_13900 [Rhodobacteraceae bacterium]|nr:hypothetical protein [Paracoccaceae bacterium]